MLDILPAGIFIPSQITVCIKMKMITGCVLGAMLFLSGVAADCKEDISNCMKSYDDAKSSQGINCNTVKTYLDCIPQACLGKDAFPDSFDEEAGKALKANGVHCNFVGTSANLKSCSAGVAQCGAEAAAQFGKSEEVCGVGKTYLQCIFKSCPVTMNVPKVTTAETESYLKSLTGKDCALGSGQAIRMSGALAAVFIMASILIRSFLTDF